MAPYRVSNYSASIDNSVLKQRRLHNISAHICRLPLEILISIFLCVQYESPCISDRSAGPFTLKWVRLMLVCCHFRTVAVQAPVLWNVLEPKFSQRWKALALERSRDALLHLDYSTEPGDCIEHVPRACSVCIRNPIPPNVAAFEAANPHMTRLTIRGYSEPAFTVTSRFFGGATISLAHLHLTGPVVFIDSAPSMPCLRRLTLSYVKTQGYITTITSILLRTPALEDLFIKNINQSRSPDQVTPTLRHISLPKLKTLFLELDSVCISTFLRVLPVPTTSLGVSIHQAAAPQFDQYHEHIYTFCVSFLHQAPQAVGFRGGSVKFIYPQAAMVDSHVGLVEFGVPWDGLQTPTSHFFFSCECIFDSAHPLLSGVETACICGYTGYPRDPESVLQVGAQYMPNLRDVVFDVHASLGLEHAWLHRWIAQRDGCIKHVELRCFTVDQAEPFVDELRRYGLDPDVYCRPSLEQVRERAAQRIPGYGLVHVWGPDVATRGLTTSRFPAFLRDARV
jgi:hypothetical protein